MAQRDGQPLSRFERSSCLLFERWLSGPGSAGVARTSISLSRGDADGAFFTSCRARESAVAARGLAAVSRERAAEGVLGRVANLARDRPNRVGGVLQPLRLEMRAPAREVGQRRLAHDLREAPCERRAGDVYLARERLDRPWLGRPR